MSEQSLATGGQSTTDKAKEKVQETAGQLQERTGEVAQQARGRVREQVDMRSTQAGDQIRSTATAMRRTSEQLRNEGNEGAAKMSDAVAERADRLGSYLTQTDGDQMLRQVEDFARRQPWLVAFGGLVLGFAASRFLKASSSRRYEQRFDSQRSLPARTYDVSPTTSGIHTAPVTAGPTMPPAEPPVTAPMPAGTPGATAPGSYEGSR